MVPIAKMISGTTARRWASTRTWSDCFGAYIVVPDWRLIGNWVVLCTLDKTEDDMAELLIAGSRSWK